MLNFAPNLQKQVLDDWFEYHPPKTEERKAAHDRVNKAALEFAKTVIECVDNQTVLQMSFFAIQQARMFANQGITMDELNRERLTPSPGESKL